MQLGSMEKFSILVSDNKYGSIIKEADKPSAIVKERSENSYYDGDAMAEDECPMEEDWGEEEEEGE